MMPVVARRLRVPLPTYPFEGQDYWLAPEAPSSRRKGVARTGVRGAHSTCEAGNDRGAKEDRKVEA